MTAARLASGSVNSTDQIVVYASEDNNPFVVDNCVLTNASTSVINISLSFSDDNGVTTQLVRTVKLPPLAGKAVIVPEMMGSFNGGDNLYLQADSGSTWSFLITGQTYAYS